MVERAGVVGQRLRPGEAALLNNQPRPQAVVLGRPPRGGRLREVAPVGGVAGSRIQAIPPCSAEASPGRTPWMPSRGRFPGGSTPDRSKLFGSHGQRPWI